MLSVMVSAQSRISYLRQFFESDEFPSDWTFEGDATGNWEIWPTHQAGGEPNELKLYWRPAFNGTARFVSPAVNLTGVNEVIFSFKAFLDNYQNMPHQMGVATSSDNGATWNIAWQETYATPNQGQHSIVANVTTSDMGKENVKFCIFYTGDSNNMNGWYFDDIEVYTLDQLNLSMLLIDFPNIVGIEDNQVGFKVQNIGVEGITSFEASYQIDDKTPVVETFQTNLSSTMKGDFVFSTPVSVAPGAYTLTLSILKVNGVEDVTYDNVIAKDIKAAIGTAQRTPMIEHFSSSTCAPCVMVNEAMAILTENNPGKYSYTKYPMNWPLEGDAYCTQEGLTRKSYYNVTGAPQLFIDGIDQGGYSITQNLLNERLSTPAYIDIKGAFNMDGSTITVSADVMALVNMPETRIYVSVNEKTTTGNVGYNGETEFHHIMMKMLDDAEGTEATFQVGETKHYEFTYDMSNTFMEETTDLEVAVWAQDYVSYEIFNSHFLYEYTDHPYPAQNLQLEGSEEGLNITWEAPAQGAPVGYDVYVNNQIKAENTTELSLFLDGAAGLKVVSIIAKYENDKQSVSLAGTIDLGGEEEEEIICNAPTNLNAAIEQDAEGFDHFFKVTMTWDAADNANEYVVYLDGEMLDTTTETSYVKGFNEEGTHHFTVSSVCENGESEQSEAFEFEIKGESISELSNNVKVYPNPVDDVLYINTNENITEVNVYNVVGVKMTTVNGQQTNVSVNMSNLNSGVYFVEVKTEKENIIKKIVVE